MSCYFLYLGNWKDELQKYISPDQLPAMYGGNRYEPDAECSNYICPGRDVHPKYYLTNQTKTSMEDMERVVVRRGASHKVQCEVTDVRSTLRWEFFTTGYDIAFGISIKKKEEDKKCNIVRQMSALQDLQNLVILLSFSMCHLNKGHIKIKFNCLL